MKATISRMFRRCTMTAGLILSTLTAAIAQPNTNDPSFNAGTGFSSGFATGMPCEISRIVQQSDGKLLVGGSFTSYNSNTLGHIARLNVDGSIDNTFKTGTGFNSTMSGNPTNVEDILSLPDGKVMMSGWFNSYNGTPCGSVVRLNNDGTIDPTFTYDTRMGWNFVLQPDGKIVTGTVRINTDGTLDPTYTPAQAFTSETIVALPSGKFIGVGGSSNDIFMLNNDGTRDNTFNIPGGFDGRVNNIVVQPDGKFIVSGAFKSFNGVARYRFGRLNADGTLDPGFNFISSSSVNEPRVLKLQSDGKLLVGSKLALYRLNIDGTLDQSFQTPVIIGNEGEIWDICIQKDGKIVIGGDFAQAGTSTATGIARFMGAATGINDNTGSGSIFSLFPNPASRQLHIQCKGHSFPSASFTIYDIAGKIVRNWTDVVTDNYSKTVDISDIPKGQYMLRTSVDKLAYQRFTVIHSQ